MTCVFKSTQASFPAASNRLIWPYGPFGGHAALRQTRNNRKDSASRPKLFPVWDFPIDKWTA